MENNLDEYIKTLSPEELIFYKDHIAECRKREKGINDSSKRTMDNLNKLADSLGAIVSGINKIHKTVSETNRVLSDIEIKVEHAKEIKSLEKLSDDDFFKA